MSITYAWAETGHPNCRRPDKVIDARHAGFVEQLKHRLSAEVLGRNITQDSDAYILREPDVAYNAHFDTKKEVLSMDNGVYFDENEGGINRLAWSD